MSEETFEAARQAFEVAREAVGDAAETMLVGAILDAYPDAVAYRLYGEFESDEKLNLNLEAVNIIGNNTTIEISEDSGGDGFAELVETVNDYLLYLANARDEALVDTNWFNIESRRA